MIFGYFTLLVALTISAVAEYYSIVGLTAIFSAAFWPIVIMGASLGVGKVTAAVWLKLNWERAPIAYKLYLVPAVAFLMLLTSIGCFGFLSKAHSDQNLVSGDSMAKVAIYDEKIKTAKDNIETNRTALKQMDAAVDQVMARSDDEKGADKAVGIRRSQSKERTRLLAEIEVEQKKVAALSEERAPYAAEFRRIENEVGPIKYIAALVYGDNPDANILEKAVRLVIILIVAVFDPLALVLILAAQQSIRWARETVTESAPVIEEPVVVDEKAAVVDAEPIAQSVSAESTPIEQVDLFAYLKKPFVHFSNLTPMPSHRSIMEDAAAMSIAEPNHVETRPFTEEEIIAMDYEPDDGPLTDDQIEQVKKSVDAFKPLIKPLQGQEAYELMKSIGIFTPDGKLAYEYGGEEPENDGVDEQQFLEDFDANLAKGHEINSPAILKMGIDDVERPGDYITPPAQREAAPGPNRGVMYVPPVQADNAIELGKASNTSFGNEYPAKPEKGDLYLRTDFLPNRLFKFNGSKWIEVDKSQTDVYAYEEQYIKYLIEEIDAGRYDLESLTDIEKEQIQQYLANK
jgi:hypothetical protein